MSLTSPDLRTLQSIVRLGAIDSGYFENWLKENIERALSETMTQRDEVLLRQAQGRAQVLSELLMFFTKAPELLEAERTRRQAEPRRFSVDEGQGSY